MMKKLIAILLVCTIFLSALPVAFAANANTGMAPQSFKRGSKVILHIDKTLPLIKQSLMDILDEGIAPFTHKNNYFITVWNEAQALYRAEARRIMAATNLSELVTSTPLGLMANDTTFEVYEQLTLLSELDKSEVKKAADLTRLKSELKAELVAEMKEYCIRREFNDFYWDKIITYKDEAFADIAGANTFTKYVKAESRWEYFFEFEPIDAEFADVFEYLEADVLHKEELSDLAALLEDMLLLNLADYENMGYDIEKTGVLLALENYESACEKAEYANKIVKIFNSTLAEIAAEVGVDLSAKRAPATISVRNRMYNKVTNLFYTYDQSNYTDEGWEEIEDIYIAAVRWIATCEYKDEISDKFYKNVAEELKAVKTYAAQLKEYKAECIEDLRSYLGERAYNQVKVKKYVADGTKLINAAKTFEAVDTVYVRYITALEKTVYTFKITVSKVGKGSVTKTGTVKYGANFTVKIVPNAGYRIKSIVVDGKKVKLTNAYTFKNVTKAHSIKVIFG